MNRYLLVLIVLGFCCLEIHVAQTQQKSVSFKKLQEFLPKIDLPGYKRGKPGGQSSTAMGMSTSEAKLAYEKVIDEMTTHRIDITISDVIGVPFAAAGISMLGTTEFENETEDGYEKSVKIHGYPGTERAQTGEYKSCEISLAVGNRFMVTLHGDGTGDAGLLKKLLDNMKLADLAKLAQ